MIEQLERAVASVRERVDAPPRVGIVLGSGLGALADSLEQPVEVRYSTIPGWPASTAMGHAGMLVFGRLGGAPVVVMSGRAHLYEGYDPPLTVFGVRVLGLLGVEVLILTNAVGAIDTELAPGQLVLVSDHINLQASSPLVGPNVDALGPRFPDLSAAYDRALRSIAHAAAAAVGIELREAVYAAWLGPAFETPAEIRMIRALGGDVVGMSLVGEVIAARHMGVRVLAISCVTNMAAGILPEPLDGEHILRVGAEAAGRLTALIREIVPVVTVPAT